MFAAGSLWGGRRHQLPLDALLHKQGSVSVSLSVRLWELFNPPPRHEGGMAGSQAPSVHVPNIVIPSHKSARKSVNKRGRRQA